MIFLEKVFQLLIENKELPYYQAERRIDIFINFFIEDIIQQTTKFKDAIYVAAEFPLKKGAKTDHARHLDYLMFSKSERKILFVELKTDDKSYNEEQMLLYANHDHFLMWYQQMLTIKMKGFAKKKQNLVNVIRDKIGDIGPDLLIESIILMPSAQESIKIQCIELKSLDIRTEHRQEWKLLKDMLLSQL